MKRLAISMLIVILMGCNYETSDLELTSPQFCAANKNGDLLSSLCEYEKFRNVVVKEHEWFEQEAREQRLLYRVAGGFIIFISILIPFLVKSNLRYKENLISIAAITVATFTALSGFFDWSGNWDKYKKTQYEYRDEIRSWDLYVKSIVMDKGGSDSEKIRLVHDRTHELLEKASAINTNSLNEFFLELEQLGKDAQGNPYQAHAVGRG